MFRYRVDACSIILQLFYSVKLKIVERSLVNRSFPFSLSETNDEINISYLVDDNNHDERNSLLKRMKSELKDATENIQDVNNMADDIVARDEAEREIGKVKESVMGIKKDFQVMVPLLPIFFRRLI